MSEVRMYMNWEVITQAEYYYEFKLFTIIILINLH